MFVYVVCSLLDRSMVWAQITAPAVAPHFKKGFPVIKLVFFPLGHRFHTVVFLLPLCKKDSYRLANFGSSARPAATTLSKRWTQRVTAIRVNSLKLRLGLTTAVDSVASFSEGMAAGFSLASVVPPPSVGFCPFSVEIRSVNGLSGLSEIGCAP